MLDSMHWVVNQPFNRKENGLMKRISQNSMVALLLCFLPMLSVE